MKGTPHFTPWQEDPDPPAYWEDDQYEEMRRRMRAYWNGTTTDALRPLFEEKKHPRGKGGKWIEAGWDEKLRALGIGMTSGNYDRYKIRSLYSKEVGRPKRAMDIEEMVTAILEQREKSGESELLTRLKGIKSVSKMKGKGVVKATSETSGEHPGKGYSNDAFVDSNGVIHTTNVYDAQRALFEDRRVDLKQPKMVSTLIRRLGETALEMTESGGTAPTFNLCNVTIKGTNLFCADQIGIPRVEMPVIRASKTKEFVAYLEEKGYAVEEGREKASNLRASQSELSGEKVAAAMQRIKNEGKFYKRIVISRDDYILDGHHTWAGQLGHDAADNNLENDGRQVKVARIDIGIIDLIREAEEWTGGAGKKAASEKARVHEKGGEAGKTPRLAKNKVAAPDLERKLAQAKKANKPKENIPGLVTRTDTEMWQQAIKAHKIAAPFAEDLGFDSDRLNYSITGKGRVAADYDGNTGDITIYRRSLFYPPDILKPLIAHEVTHHKFEIVRDDADSQSSEVRDLFKPHMEYDNVEKLRRSAGGISAYADGFWKIEAKQIAKGGLPKGYVAVDTTLAINETLCEIAHNIVVDGEQKTRDKTPKVWMDFYDDLNKAYIKVGGMKKQTWFQAQNA